MNMIHYKKRWKRIQELLENEKKDAFVVSVAGNIRYLCCVHVPEFPIVSKVIIPRDGEPVAVAPTLEEFRASEESAIKNLRIFAQYKDIEVDGKDADGVVNKELKRLKAKDILADTKMKMRGIKCAESEIVTQMRVHKEVHEINMMKEAVKITKKGEEYLNRILKVGRTELEVAADLDHFLRNNGAKAMSFMTIVATGTNAAYSHHEPGHTKIKKGDPVVVDFGVYYQGYCSDVTRSFIMGKNRKFEKIYELVEKAHDDAIKMSKIGKKFSAIDNAAREAFRKEGLARYFVHNTGHGLGIEVHENVTWAPPAVGLSLSDNKVEKGNVFTIEPGIYLPGEGGIRIEDDIYVAGKTVHVLTK